MMFLKWLFKSLIILIIFCVISVSLFYYEIIKPMPLQKTQTFDVNKGDTSYRIGKKLVQRGWLQYSILTRFIAKLHPNWVPKVGKYEITSNINLLDMMALFNSGKSIVYTVTLIEGNTLQDYLQEMKAKSNITITLNGLSNLEIAKKLAIKRSNPEGLFFASTYQYSDNTTDVEILKRAHQQLKLKLDGEWKKRDKDLPYKNPYQALIMASMIEKETGMPKELGLIAGVFSNRLRKGMRLQTDPTVIYVLGKIHNETLTYKDLQYKSPYNTYLHDGFPPTPITNVGIKAIVAASHPKKTNALYFVAKGDGSHVFSNTLDEHNKAVEKYQKQSHLNIQL